MKVSQQKMKLVALGALIICAVGMVVCRIYEGQYPWLIWVRAFCEAGTVGAIADWFAVVALFRHPMGIPIPHTAILPKNKERVGQSLATFIDSSFLTREALEPRLAHIDYAGEVSKFLDKYAPVIAEKATEFAPQLLASLDKDEMVALLASRARDFIGKTDFASLASQGLDVLVEGGHDREIFDGLLKSAHQLIEDNRKTIEQKIHEEVPLPTLDGIPFLSMIATPILEEIKRKIAASIAEKTVKKVQATLAEAASNQAHPLRASFDKRLHGLIADLQDSPALTAKIQSLQDRLAESKAIDDFAARVWEEISSFILRDAASPDSTLRKKIQAALESFSRQLADNEKTRLAINDFLSKQVIETALTSKDEIRDLIVTTVRKWDAKKMTDQLENVVGADLQFIRLNGTIVGGLAGLAIHAAFCFFGK